MPSEPGIGVGCFGFSWKPVTRSVVSTCDDAEARRVLDRHLEAGDRRRGAALAMEAQHARVVHLVDVVAGEDDDVLRVLARDRVEVLVDGVGGAEIPVLADALLRAAGSR